MMTLNLLFIDPLLREYIAHCGLSTLHQSVFCFSRPAAEDYIHSKKHHLSDLTKHLLITQCIDEAALPFGFCFGFSIFSLV